MIGNLSGSQANSFGIITSSFINVELKIKKIRKDEANPDRGRSRNPNILKHRIT